MSVLTKDQILSSDDLVKEKVSCPEWGGDVYVRTLTGTERDEFEALVYDQQEEGKKQNVVNFRAKFLVFCIVDENGDRMFDTKEIELLGKKSGKVLDRLWEASQRLSKLREQDKENLIKNS